MPIDRNVWGYPLQRTWNPGIRSKGTPCARATACVDRSRCPWPSRSPRSPGAPGPTARADLPHPARRRPRQHPPRSTCLRRCSAWKRTTPPESASAPWTPEQGRPSRTGRMRDSATPPPSKSSSPRDPSPASPRRSGRRRGGTRLPRSLSGRSAMGGIDVGVLRRARRPRRSGGHASHRGVQPARPALGIGGLNVRTPLHPPILAVRAGRAPSAP